jgi:hypothetical protein
MQEIIKIITMGDVSNQLMALVGGYSVKGEQ